MRHMTLRGTMNMASATLLVTTLLFAFFTWTSRKWVDSVDTTLATLGPRVDKIETVAAVKWESTDHRLDSIEKKMDVLIARGR